MTGITQQQADMEVNMQNLRKLFQKARKAQENAQKLELSIYEAMENMRVDVHSPTTAQNSTDLKYTIHKYLHTGAYGLRNIMKEIRLWCE